MKKSHARAACLLGSLFALLFVHAPPAPAQAIGAVTQTAPPAPAQTMGVVTHTPQPHLPQGYFFVAMGVGDAPAAAGGPRAFVCLHDARDPTFQAVVVEILSGDRGMTRMQRAKVIAARMQTLTETRPTWFQDMKIVQVDGAGCVVGDGKTGQFLMTADSAAAKRFGAASQRDYAGRLITSIQERLINIKPR